MPKSPIALFRLSYMRFADTEVPPICAVMSALVPISEVKLGYKCVTDQKVKLEFADLQLSFYYIVIFHSSYITALVLHRQLHVILPVHQHRGIEMSQHAASDGPLGCRAWKSVRAARL